MFYICTTQPCHLYKHVVVRSRRILNTESIESGKWKKINIQKALPSSYARYSEKRFTQIYKALYGDVMFVSAALKHGIRNPEAETESWKRKRKRNTESNTNDRKLKNFTLHKLVI